MVEDFELLELVKICVFSKWTEGLLALLNSKTSHTIFIHSSFDFKEQFVKYLLSDETLDKLGSSISSLDAIKKLKTCLVEFPYCSVSWLVIDHFRDYKNIRYVKNLISKFVEDECMLGILDQCNHIDEIIKKIQSMSIWMV